MRGKDLTGQRFGKLLVLKLDEDFETIRGTRQRRWICQCDCGTIKSIAGAELTRTKKPQRSCGCAAAERAKNFGQVTFRDISNQRFGSLVAIKKIDTNKYGYAIWECQCDCGNHCEVTSRELLSGDTISCGCQAGKYWENQVGKILEKNNIQFKRQYSFSDLRDIFPLRFDFALFVNNSLVGLIEYQGSQHTNKKDHFYTEKLVQHDLMKKNYCKEHNIPLFEIQYFEAQQLEEKIRNIIERVCLLSDSTTVFM